jgi:hypothetical protein
MGRPVPLVWQLRQPAALATSCWWVPLHASTMNCIAMMNPEGLHHPLRASLLSLHSHVRIHGCLFGCRLQADDEVISFMVMAGTQ